MFTEFWDDYFRYEDEDLIERGGLRVYGEPGVDTALTVRLRAQHQLGIPAKHVAVCPSTAKGTDMWSKRLRDDEVAGKDCKVLFCM